MDIDEIRTYRVKLCWSHPVECVMMMMMMMMMIIIIIITVIIILVFNIALIRMQITMPQQLFWRTSLS